MIAKTNISLGLAALKFQSVMDVAPQVADAFFQGQTCDQTVCVQENC